MPSFILLYPQASADLRVAAFSKGRLCSPLYILMEQSLSIVPPNEDTLPPDYRDQDTVLPLPYLGIRAVLLPEPNLKWAGGAIYQNVLFMCWE